MSQRHHVLELSKRFLKIFVPLVSDVLDDEYGGLKNNFLMSSDIKPLVPDGQIAGVALTFRGATTWKEPSQPSLEELRGNVGIRALEGITSGDVVVYDTGGCTDVAAWGELISNAAAARGGHGAVVDGAVRDVVRMSWIKPSFHVFAKSTTPADSKGRFDTIECNVPVRCGGVRVEPGDFIFGDPDGVVVIPKKIVEEVLVKSEERMAREDKAREALRKGNPLADTIHTYGVG
jgi:4-hydroxy-4-methyl-2-oxoglutarate aldolase